VNSFKRARLVQGLTQIELGKKVGVSSVAVCKWERGVTTPSAKRLKKVADVLNTTINELLADGKEAG
jgi:transcriptional regulator with XRE-family HTH domain